MIVQLMHLMIFPDPPLAARRANFRERSRRNFQQLALFVSCRFLNEAKLLKVFIWKTRGEKMHGLPPWQRFKTLRSTRADTCYHYWIRTYAKLTFTEAPLLTKVSWKLSRNIFRVLYYKRYAYYMILCITLLLLFKIFVKTRVFYVFLLDLRFLREMDNFTSVKNYSKFSE